MFMMDSIFDAQCEQHSFLLCAPSDVLTSAAARIRLAFWKGAAARSVASTLRQMQGVRVGMQQDLAPDKL